MKYSYIAFAALILMSANGLKAQTVVTEAAKTDSAKKADKPKYSYFKPTLGYLSNSVYNGRKDSALISYLEPGIAYYDKSGFNVSASANYLVSSSAHRIDLYTLGIGYDFNINKNWDLSLNAEKDHYSDSSKAVQGGTKGSMSADMLYDFDLVQAGAGAEMLFEETTQYTSYLSLAHAFEFGKEDTALWSITPSVKAIFGTEGFIDQNTKRRLKRKNPGNKITAVTNIVGGTNAFAILDYEWSMPVSYETKKWGITFTPTYSMPVNATTTITETINYKNGIQQGLPVQSVNRENLSNTFYFELEAFWRFDLKKK